MDLNFKKISEEDAVKLELSFTLEEIKEASQWPDMKFPFDDIARLPSYLYIEQMQQLVKLVRSWEPSLSGHVNFIIDGDGVILGPNKSSLGGVLHDENGDIVVFF
ncbi:hypothetical protein Goshw_029056 [Gossypium schwendimanii]|uniref:Uncharacterized protein n=1 Tax=Gossypium schwendimanii TaxID=34291 RepID=A0A7J9LIK6_GOSSC|nr:hypothetical protein [Gossypium schwendimanii]